jgi:hypothetical protein
MWLVRSVFPTVEIVAEAQNRLHIESMALAALEPAKSLNNCCRAAGDTT